MYDMIIRIELLIAYLSIVSIINQTRSTPRHEALTIKKLNQIDLTIDNSRRSSSSSNDHRIDTFFVPETQKMPDQFNRRILNVKKTPFQKNRQFNESRVAALLNQPSSYAVARQEIPNRDSEFTIYPRYSYNYGVLDISTGDTKAAWEERDGDLVRGEYSVVEADGTIRVVAYTADDLHGFKAVITRQKSPMQSDIARISRMMRRQRKAESTTFSLDKSLYNGVGNDEGITTSTRYQ